jgi:hypothetical protein
MQFFFEDFFGSSLKPCTQNPWIWRVDHNRKKISGTLINIRIKVQQGLRALRRLRQEDGKLEASLCYIARLCLKKKR